MSQLIKDIIKLLNKATKAYDEGKPIMSDKDWDKIYFELESLENRTGIIYPDSPTQSIFYDTVSKLNKKEHNHKMLSLQKTKDIEDVINFFGNNYIVAMCKMDGLTCSLTYKDGALVSAETRGNGLVGEDILHNAQIIPSIPQRISTTEEITIDGEIICTVAEFEKVSEKYKNSRNYAAGSIRLLNSEECASRNLTFVAWDIPFPVHNALGGELSQAEKLAELMELGFETVPFVEFKSSETSVETIIEYLKAKAFRLSYPIDGIVFKFSDCEYGRSLGETAHHFKNAIAYKFYDEVYETNLLDIEWQIGRTGQITPVAIFEPIEIDGTTVERASLHNLSILYEIFGSNGPFVGQTITVFKSNMINPQIAEAFDKDQSHLFYLDKTFLEPPERCPICGGATVERDNSDSRFLVCDNANCEGKLINKLNYFCGKSGLDIKGLSKATIEKLIDWGWIETFADLYVLGNYRGEWVKKPGFGEKSVDKILKAIEDSKDVNLENFIAAIGIPLIGLNMAKELTKVFSTYADFRAAIDGGFDFATLDGFAEAKHKAIVSFDYTQADDVAKFMITKEKNEESNSELSLKDMTFVITGKLETFKNRAELQSLIEKNGGKVVSSVSAKVNFLINNDIDSGSAKNVSAKKLGIPIISEKNFLEMI